MDLIADGKLSQEGIDDLGDIMVGKKPCHKKEDEIVIFSVGGMPIEDVAWGTIVYRNALKANIGLKINLWNEPHLA
jgi:ornithine cyclodeaminase